MGKDSKQTTSQELDPTTKELQRLAIGSGLGALGLSGTPDRTVNFFGHNITLPGTGIAAFGPKLQDVPGVSPLTQQAIGNFQNVANAGNLGLNALSGDQGAIDTLFNPFQ